MSRNNDKTAKKYLLMPDSFKGTMDSITVCNIMRDAILCHDKNAQIICIPIADGGEGTVDCFIEAFGGTKVNTVVKGPYNKDVDAFYGKLGDTAVVELAAAAGFSQVAEQYNNPAKASTYGVGQLVKKAVESGNNRIILGLGGSCSNDGGAGMAAALGTKFYDKNGSLFIPTGDRLCEITHIDNTQTMEYLQNIDIQVMCDINNPLHGSNGAAYIFAPQKGADREMVVELDMNLQYFADIIKTQLRIDVSQLPGAGAAGGAGAGACAFLGAELKQGIDVILDLLNFEELLKDCKVIFTGEGQLDKQSLGGKVVVGISKRAARFNVPVIAVVGRIKGDLSDISKAGIWKVFQTDPGTYDTNEEMLKNCRNDLARTMEKTLNKI